MIKRPGQLRYGTSNNLIATHLTACGFEPVDRNPQRVDGNYVWWFEIPDEKQQIFKRALTILKSR